MVHLVSCWDPLRCGWYGPPVIPLSRNMPDDGDLGKLVQEMDWGGLSPPFPAVEHQMSDDALSSHGGYEIDPWTSYGGANVTRR